MRASEAAEEVRKAKAREKLLPVFEKVKYAAAKGLSFVELGPHEIGEYGATVLRQEYGYVVDEEWDRAPHDHAETTGWVIRW